MAMDRQDLGLDTITENVDLDEISTEQDIGDPSWFPFTTDGAMTFDHDRHGSHGILTVHGFMDLLGHLKEDSAEEVREWLEGGAEKEAAPGWLTQELIPLFTQSWYFQMHVNAATLGAGVAQYTTTGTFPYGPRQGRAWSILSIGAELSAAGFFHVYKGTLGAVGTNKVVGHTTVNNSAIVYLPYAKGQLSVHNGEPLSFQPSTGNIQSLYVTGIDLPASRIAEFVVA